MKLKSVVLLSAALLIAAPSFAQDASRASGNASAAASRAVGVVVGGVYEFRNRQDVEKLPWVGDLPILGNLFKKKLKGNSKAELLVFVTPRVLKVAQR